MFSNSKIISVILIAGFLIISSSCVEPHFRDPATKYDNCKIEGTWATYKIVKQIEDIECDKPECKKPIGLVNVECEGKKVVGEHFLGNDMQSGKEIWVKASGHIEGENVTISFININQYTKKPKNRIVYKINKIANSRLYGEYYIRRFSDDKLISKSKISGIKRVRSWRQPKP